MFKAIYKNKTYNINYNKNIIKNLSTPEFIITNNNLVLGNNAAYQLSVLEHDESTYMSGTKYKCLLDVVNNAVTAMGKRYTKLALLNPSSCPKVINSRLDNVEKLLTSSYKDFPEKLSLISDIEKLKRKINLGILQPIEMADFIESFIAIQSLLIDINKLKLNNIITDKTIIKEIEEFNTNMQEIIHQSSDENQRQQLTKMFRRHQRLKTDVLHVPSDQESNHWSNHH